MASDHETQDDYELALERAAEAEMVKQRRAIKDMMMNEAEINSILHQTAADYPRAWQHAHHEGDPERWDWIILATRRLIAAFVQIGGNWRRGVVNDLSMDGISVFVENEWRFADVITGAGGPNPQINYKTPGHDALLRNAAGQPIGFAGVADTRTIPTHVDYSDTPTQPPAQPPTQPPPVSKPPYLGDQFWVENFGRIYMDDLARASQTANEGSWIWAGRVSYDHYIGGLPIEDAVKKHREGPGGWLKAMGL